MIYTEGSTRLVFPQHFDGKRFYNPEAPQAYGFREVIRWKRTSRAAPSPGFLADVEPCKPPKRVESGQLRATLVNHSTVLLQQRNSNILTDPIWSDRASPLSWAGPRRRRLPGVSWEDLPPIDTVLISHNHYDHLDVATLCRLALDENCTFVVPAGVGRLLSVNRIGPVHEMDWGESLPLGGLTIHCVPALHFSSRGLFDRNLTLWCGYMIESPHGLTYFAGDTGFGRHFSQIRERFGSPRLALLPIGAYEPRWFMAPVHMAPAEAIRAHRMLGAGTSIAIHHGTFQLADEALDAPRKEVVAEAPGGSFLILANGQFTDIL